MGEMGGYRPVEQRWKETPDRIKFGNNHDECSVIVCPAGNGLQIQQATNFNKTIVRHGRRQVICTTWDISRGISYRQKQNVDLRCLFADLTGSYTEPSPLS
jgi:hypothetical protein